MMKTLESNKLVSYKVEEKLPVNYNNTFLNPMFEIKAGRFIFDKKFQTITFIEEETDLFLINDEKVKNICLRKMIKCLNEKKFPDIIYYQTCDSRNSNN